MVKKLNVTPITLAYIDQAVFYGKKLISQTKIQLKCRKTDFELIYRQIAIYFLWLNILLIKFNKIKMH